MSRQNPNRSRATPGSRHGLVDRAELLHRRSHPEATTGAVLEHQEDAGAASPTASMTDRMPCGEALDPGRRAIAPVRPDVDVDEPRPVQLGHAQLVDQDVHGPPVRLGVRAGEVDEVGGMDRERGDAVTREAIPERRQLQRRRGRRRHEVGLSLKTWSADAPISAARSAALTMPCPSGRWAPSRRPFGSIGRRVAERVVPERVTARRPASSTPRSGPLREPDLDCRAWTPTCSPASAPSWTSTACGSWAGWRPAPPISRPSPAS